MKKHFLMCVLLVLCTHLQAQYFPFFQQEYFFGYGPSPRVDAMAKSDVAIGGTVASSARNPAGIGLIDHAQFDFTTTGNFYYLLQSDYFFTGGAYRIHDRFIAALSYNILQIGETSFNININGENYPTDKPRAGNLALTVSGEPVKNLHIGLNLNYFRWKYIDEVPGANAFMLDLGILYDLVFGGDDGHQGLRIGGSVTNVAKGSITFASPEGDEANNNFPIIGRYGITYYNDRLISKESAKGKSFLGLLATFEAQDLLNNDYRTAFRVAVELVAYEIFAFRMGYFTQSEDDMGIATNKDRFGKFTYGFGLIFPVEDLSKGKVPMDLTFDFTAMNQPPVTETAPFASNMRSFGISAIFSMNHLNKSTND